MLRTGPPSAPPCLLPQVADALQFLHQDCSLVHCAVCPDSIMVVGGAWKLAAMGFASLADFSSEGGETKHSHVYSPGDTELARMLKPPLRYVAPELIAGNSTGGPLGSSVDTYSFGATLREK